MKIEYYTSFDLDIDILSDAIEAYINDEVFDRIAENLDPTNADLIGQLHEHNYSKIREQILKNLLAR